MKEKIRPLYSELQGYHAQAPSTDHWGINNKSFWEQYNKAVKELEEVTGKSYERFLIKETDLNKHIPLLDGKIYLQKLGGLIARLHGEYFKEEAVPFRGMPNTIITQTQQQSVDVTMLLDIQSKIDEKLPNFQEGSKEKTFLTKLKNSLKGIAGVSPLLAELLKIAKDSGLSIEDLKKIFS